MAHNTHSVYKKNNVATTLSHQLLNWPVWDELKEYIETPQSLRKREQYHVKAASVKPVVKMKTKHSDSAYSGVTKQEWDICMKTHTQNGGIDITGSVTRTYLLAICRNLERVWDLILPASWWVSLLQLHGCCQKIQDTQIRSKGLYAYGIKRSMNLMIMSVSLVLAVLGHRGPGGCHL